MSCLIYDCWLMLGLEMLSISRCLGLEPLITDGILLYVLVTGQSLMALFTRAAKLDPGAHGARCMRNKAVCHAVGISRQRNSGYRPSRVNIMAQGLSTSLSHFIP